MSGSQIIIQADYDPLTQIALHCDDCGQHVQAGYATLVEQVDRLRVGEWEGDAATLFYASMDQDVLPALERLKASFYASHDVLQELVRLFQSADEEAAQALNFNEESINGTGVSNGHGGGSKHSPRRRYRRPPTRGGGPPQGGDDYPDPDDYLDRYDETNAGDWIAGIFRGYVTDYDEEGLARDLFNDYIVNGTASDLQFALDVLNEVGQPRKGEVFDALGAYLLDDDFAANLASTREGRIFAMELINEMNEPWYLPNSGSPYGGAPTPLYMNNDLAADFIHKVFPDIATLENEPWFNTQFGNNFMNNASAVNGQFNLLDDRGGPVVFDRAEITIQIPIDADINGYFGNILENSPSSVPNNTSIDVLNWGFNDLTYFTPNSSAQSFAPIIGNTGLGSVFNIDFLRNADAAEFVPSLFRGGLDGGVMLVDSTFSPTAIDGGSFTFQAMTINGNVLPEFGARQFGYTVDSIDPVTGMQTVTIYTQAASRPSDILTEGSLSFGIGGDLIQPASWDMWLQDIGYDITNNQFSGSEIIDITSFTTNYTD